METLPKDYFLRGHNKEYYVQEQIYKKLRFLNELPMVQNLNSTKSASENHPQNVEQPSLKVSCSNGPTRWQDKVD